MKIHPVLIIASIYCHHAAAYTTQYSCTVTRTPDLSNPIIYHYPNAGYVSSSTCNPTTGWNCPFALAQGGMQGFESNASITSATYDSSSLMPLLVTAVQNQLNYTLQSSVSLAPGIDSYMAATIAEYSGGQPSYNCVGASGYVSLRDQSGNGCTFSPAENFVNKNIYASLTAFNFYLNPNKITVNNDPRSVYEPNTVIFTAGPTAIDANIAMSNWTTKITEIWPQLHPVSNNPAVFRCVKETKTLALTVDPTVDFGTVILSDNSVPAKLKTAKLNWKSDGEYSLANTWTVKLESTDGMTDGTDFLLGSGRVRITDEDGHVIAPGVETSISAPPGHTR